VKITDKQIRLLIREALKDIKYATHGEEGYDFKSQFPDEATELYGQTIAGEVGNIEMIKDFFKESIIDVNIIVLPDRVFKDLIAVAVDALGGDWTDLFEAVVDKSFLGKLLNWASAKFRNLAPQLQQVRSQLDAESYNIIIQRKDRKGATGFLFDLSWITHDMFGHALNFQQVKHPLYKVLNDMLAMLTFGGVVPNKFAGGGKLEQTLKVTQPELYVKIMGKLAGEDTDIYKTVVKAVIADLEKESFTPGVGNFDLGASVIGYYVVKGKFPQTIYDMVAAGVIDGEVLSEMEPLLNEQIQQMKGKAGFVNFGDQVD
jgi:hypothetical protein